MISFRCPSGKVSPGEAGVDYLGFEYASLRQEPLHKTFDSPMELAVVLINGEAVVRVGSTRYQIGPRKDWETELPSTVYVPSTVECSVFPVGDTNIGVAWSECSLPLHHDARVIGPQEVLIEERGRGNTRRIVRHILPVTMPAHRLILVEVITPGGNWSSFPPHRHDRMNLPEEALLEESYLFRVQPDTQKALMAVWSEEDGDRDAAGYLVGDGDLVMITKGYHMVSAAPGSTLYYLNAMAGPQRLWKPVFHPAYRHLVEGWDDAPIST